MNKKRAYQWLKERSELLEEMLQCPQQQADVLQEAEHLLFSGNIKRETALRRAEKDYPFPVVWDKE